MPDDPCEDLHKMMTEREALADRIDAEIRRLLDEGVPPRRIAELLGDTRQRVSNRPIRRRGTEAW